MSDEDNEALMAAHRQPHPRVPTAVQHHLWALRFYNDQSVPEGCDRDEVWYSLPTHRAFGAIFADRKAFCGV
ncbi:MAG: hypothetical protein M1499_02685 [Firmicutes bacterium]|jgi:hypothetical protein|nr:hypothetical protein [Bacillota bacterium]